jgi:hypothetical protein
LSQANLCRVFRVIHGLLLGEQCDPANACLYFGVIGAYVVQQHHGIYARPVVGMAAYRLGDDYTLAFATPVNGQLRATEDGFHCWIQTADAVIDLQAPLFPAMLAAQVSGLTLPVRLFQRPQASACQTPDDVRTSGAFWHQPTLELQHLLEEFIETPFNCDLVRTAAEWYRPAPHNISPSLTMQDRHGTPRYVALSPLKPEGFW